MACPAPCRGRVGHCRVGVGHCRRARARAAGCVAVCPPCWEPALRGAGTRAAARRGGRWRQPAQGRLPCLLRPPDTHLGGAGRRSARGSHRQRRPRRPPSLLPDPPAHLAGRSAGRPRACMSRGCYLMDAASGAGGGAEGPPPVPRPPPTVPPAPLPSRSQSVAAMGADPPSRTPGATRRVIVTRRSPERLRKPLFVCGGHTVLAGPDHSGAQPAVSREAGWGGGQGAGQPSLGRLLHVGHALPPFPPPAPWGRLALPSQAPRRGTYGGGAPPPPWPPPLWRRPIPPPPPTVRAARGLPPASTPSPCATVATAAMGGGPRGRRLMGTLGWTRGGTYTVHELSICTVHTYFRR